MHTHIYSVDGAARAGAPGGRGRPPAADRRRAVRAELSGAGRKVEEEVDLECHKLMRTKH